MPVALGSQKSVESPGTGIRNIYEPLWRLGINLEFSEIRSVLNCWAISSTLNGVFKLKFIYENSSIYYQAWLKDLSYWVPNSERLVRPEEFSSVLDHMFAHASRARRLSESPAGTDVIMPIYSSNALKAGWFKWCPLPHSRKHLNTWSPVKDAVLTTLNLEEECHWRQALGV